MKNNQIEKKYSEKFLSLNFLCIIMPLKFKIIKNKTSIIIPKSKKER